MHGLDLTLVVYQQSLDCHIMPLAIQQDVTCEFCLFDVVILYNILREVAGYVFHICLSYTFETTKLKPKSVISHISTFHYPWLHVLYQVFGPATRLQRNDIRYLLSLNEMLNSCLHQRWR